MVRKGQGGDRMRMGMGGLGLGEWMGMVRVRKRGVGWWECNSGDAVGVVGWERW